MYRKCRAIDSRHPTDLTTRPAVPFRQAGSRASTRCLQYALVCALLVACSVVKEREFLPSPSPGPLGWEVPPFFSAAGLVTPDWLKGSNHSVQYEVVNDVSSKFEGSEQEDSMTKSAIGFSYLKRKLAFQFGVDPYSSNPALQDELNELTWIAFTADLAPQIGYVFMPASAIMWMTFSATRWTAYLDEQVRDNSPTDLRAMDRAKLLKMGISEDDIHQFFLNGHYSPRHSIIITTALDGLTGVDGRETFLAVAKEANSEELVLFYQHVVEMMGGYHVHIGAVERLLVLPRIPALYTKNNTLVVMLPVDYLFGPRASHRSLKP
jgi:hypothetical protein